MNKEVHTWDFFIAHAGADKAVAESLYELLAPQGRVFLDSRSLLLGDDWDQELLAAQKSSLITIVLVSSHAEKAYYQREEIAAAIELVRADKDKHRVVPVFLDDRSNISIIPYGLRMKHGLSVLDVGGLEAVARKLLELLFHLKTSQTDVNYTIGDSEAQQRLVLDEFALTFADIDIDASNKYWRGDYQYKASRSVFDWLRGKKSSKPRGGRPTRPVHGSENRSKTTGRDEESSSQRERSYTFYVHGFVSGPDPSFDITVMNLSKKPILLTAVGVEIISFGFPPPMVYGMPEAVKVKKTGNYTIQIPDFLTDLSDKIAQLRAENWDSEFEIDIHQIISTRLSDPIYLKRKAPYRYGLFLEKYYQHTSPNVRLRMWAHTNYGECVSGQIYMRKGIAV